MIHKPVKKDKIILSIIMVLFWFSLYIYVPFLTVYAKMIGASYGFIGIIGGSYGITQTILRLPIGIISDRIMKRKVFILLGIVCSLISSLLAFIIKSPYSLLAARLIAGISSATWVNFTVLFLSYFEDIDSAKTIAIANANSKMGQLIAMIVGGMVVQIWSIKEVFLFSFITALVCLLFSIFIYEEKENIDIQSVYIDYKTMVNPIYDKRIFIISVLGCFVQFIIYATNFGFTPIMAASYGMNELQLGLLTLAFILPQIFFSLISEAICSSKFNIKYMLVLGFSINTVTCAFTPFITKFNQLYLVQFLSGIGSGVTFVVLMILVMCNVQEYQRATIMGFYQATYGIGMILGPIVLGILSEAFSLKTGFIVTSFVGFISILITIRYGKILERC